MGVIFLEARYITSLKNQQVSEFYETLGFDRIEDSELEKSYVLELSKYSPKNINYVKIEYGTKN